LPQGSGAAYVDVHISNIEARGIRCVLSDTAIGMLTGFGLDGYEMGLEPMLRILARRTASQAGRVAGQ
jgi:3-dehydroquinate dehydratase II